MNTIKYLVADLADAEVTRIFEKIDIDRESGCWVWVGATVKNRGYGVFNFRGITEMVHRLLYAWLIEPLPKGVGHGIPVLDHVVCNNRKCCNPFHLRLTTQARNALRGDSPPSLNYRKEYCKRGHLLPKEPNEVWCGKTVRKGRRCIQCRRLLAYERYHKRHPEAEYLPNRCKKG